MFFASTRLRDIARTARAAVAGGCVVVVALACAALLAACGAESVGQAELWQREGQLLAWDGEVWIVDAEPIIVPPTAQVSGEQELGSRVSAVGEYDARGRMVASAVTLRDGALPEPTLDDISHEGEIEAIRSDEGMWVVGGVAVVLRDDVSITGEQDGGLLAAPRVGDRAVVNGYELPGGAILASSIVITGASNVEERPGVVVEPATPTAEPAAPTPVPATSTPEPAPEPEPEPEQPAPAPTEAPAPEPEPRDEPEPPTEVPPSPPEDDGNDDGNGPGHDDDNTKPGKDKGKDKDKTKDGGGKEKKEKPEKKDKKEKGGKHGD